MVYLENKTELQELWIPRNDGQGVPYNPTKELEGVDVTISEDITVVHPSSGYYGMSAVTIDASEYGQSNYDEGFDDGYTDGYSSGTSDGEQSIIDTFTSTTITINGQYGSSANPYSSVTVNVAQTGHTDEELQEAYNSGYTSGSTDGYNSGYTSGETHQKSLLGTTAFTINGSYSAENGYSAITVNVPTGETYNIEQNKSFTATSNGNYTITPSSGVTTVTDHFDSDIDRYNCTVNVDMSSYPSRGYFELVRIEDEFDESKGYVDIYIDNGVLDYDNSWNPREDADIDGWVGSVDIVIYNANRHIGWSLLSDFDFQYDVMSAVSLNVNVDTASTYQSGYTSGYTDGYDSGSTDGFNSGYTSGTTDGYASGYTSGTTDGFNSGYTSGYTSGHTDGVDEEKAKMSAVTFTANTAVTLSDGSYSAVTVNVPQTGGSVKYIEYLETDGTNMYVNLGTDINIKNPDEIVYFDFMPLSGNVISDGWCPFISGDMNYPYQGLGINTMWAGNDVDGSYQVKFDYVEMTLSGWSGGTKYICQLDKYGIIRNGTRYNFTSVATASTTEIETPMVINHSTNLNEGRVARARYYRFAIESGGTMLIDLRPAFDNNNIPCFYDEVTQYYYYFTNGTPTAGPVLDPSYASGYTDGQNSIISTFTATTATTNGVYGSSANPLSSITVNVPSSSGGSEDFAKLIDRSITEAVIPSGVTKIGDQAFASCQNLKSITIPNSVTSIGLNAFYGCYTLSSITIPSGVTLLGGSCFYNNFALSSITIPNSVTYLGSNVFYNCQVLTSVTFSNSLTGIPSSCFSGCKLLPNVTIPNSITTIGSYSFQNCSALTEVNIGSGVTKIDTQAFRNCIALANIYISATTAPTISNANAFQGVPSTGTVHYPAGSDYSSWQSNTYLSGWTFVADL